MLKLIYAEIESLSGLSNLGWKLVVEAFGQAIKKEKE
jgi:hypothetical protein